MKSHIVQTYLPNERTTDRRVRQRGGGEDYTSLCTEKIPTKGAIECGEKERKISLREYTSLLAQADPTSTSIHKGRHCYACESQYLELDVYDGEVRRAIVEIELAASETEVKLHVEVKRIQEATGKKSLSNCNIAPNGGRMSD